MNFVTLPPGCQKRTSKQLTASPIWRVSMNTKEIASCQRNVVSARRNTSLATNPSVGSKHPPPLSMTTEIQKRAHMCGIMSQEPTLRQQHVIESSHQTRLFQQKALTKNLVNAVVTRNGTADSSVNKFGGKNQNLLFDG